MLAPVDSHVWSVLVPPQWFDVRSSTLEEISEGIKAPGVSVAK